MDAEVTGLRRIPPRRAGSGNAGFRGKLLEMDTARIASLLAPFVSQEVGQERLSEHQLAQISTYLDLLQRWNSRINLTAVRDPQYIVTRHFGESLFAARHLLSKSLSGETQGASGRTDQEHPQSLPQAQRPGGFQMIDVGSGAGFPGLPLKIYAPGVELTLIESQNKKATFLSEVIRILALTNVDVFAGRAETFARTADLVTMRAVERFEKSLGVAANLTAPGGRLALLIGSAQLRRARALATGFEWDKPLPVPVSETRVMLCGRKSCVQESDE
jgi:16S rRNA (guanine527-N7)-methyltransferase